MKEPKSLRLMENYLKIYSAARESEDGKRCMIAPHPDLKKKMNIEIKKLTKETSKSILTNKIKFSEISAPGLNDGLVYPGEMFPLGTSLHAARSARLEKTPLRGTLRVIVVLVDFSDKVMVKTKKHYEDLFFSLNKISTGSVKEYYHEVTNGLIDIQGEVVGPFRLPKKLSDYAHGASGTGNVSPNARTMAKDAVLKSDPSVNFAQYDNDHDGFVDAFVVIHAGVGAETNNNPNDIWSHKWLLEGGAYTTNDNMKVYSYLTVPEDCRLGVCAHELGHLLFGFPDLYDTDYSSEGIGDWCLMSGGSWNGQIPGDTPAHPSAWCKCNQGWVTVETPMSNKKNVAIADVKTSKKVFKLWKNGTPGKEFFLVENRQKKNFDKFLPGAGLLIWHIDDEISDNSNEAHYRVSLMQADGKKDLEHANNRGDTGDSFPGSANKKTFNKNSTPNSKSYAGIDSSVVVKIVGSSAASINTDLNVI